MGQEASLPQGGDDEFEHQARAPPSSSNPPLSTPQKIHNPRAAGKMIGAVFQKAAHRGGGGSNIGADSTRGIVGDGGTVPYPPDGQPLYASNGNGSHPGLISPGVGSQTSAAMNPNLMSPEQQQQYHQQQQQLYHMQQQSSMMPNQYYHPQHQETQHGQQHFVVSPGQQQPLPRSLPQQNVPTHGVDPAYNTAHGTAINGGNNVNSAPKKGMSFRPSGRGAALINSMRNLSLGGGMMQRATGGPSPRGKEVNEWETRWDEDDDDSDGEDQIPSNTGGANQAAAPNLAPLHAQQLRPGMDAAHSSTSLPPMATAAGAADDVRFVSPGAAHQARTPSAADSHTQQVQKAHLITATPENDVSHSDVQLVAQQQLQRPQQQSLNRQESEDGIEWDTGMMQDQGYEKPNVEMFMPLLRVLGKGSFGKVCITRLTVACFGVYHQVYRHALTEVCSHLLLKL